MNLASGSAGSEQSSVSRYTRRCSSARTPSRAPPSHFVGSPIDYARGIGLIESILTDMGVVERLVLRWTEPVTSIGAITDVKVVPLAERGGLSRMRYAIRSARSS